MNGTLAVIPIRGSSSAKTRLAPLFTEDERLALVWTMLRRLLREIGESGVVDHTLIVTRDPGAVENHIEINPGLTILRQEMGQGGLNGALDLARSWALSHDYDVMLVLPGDLPIVGAVDIQALVGSDVPLVVASDRGEEGTNALRIDLRGWDPTVFRFRMGPGSLAHHFSEAAEMGKTARMLFRVGIAHDLDSPKDWADLSSERQRQLLQDMHDSLNAAGHLA
jgi:2-phospho-L-lactate/phosphoenolpyruvate guanylyltransferase